VFIFIKLSIGDNIMSNLNEVTLIGRLGDKPQTIKGDDKPAFVVCKIATNEYWKHEGETHNHVEWHSIEVSKPYADFVAKHCDAGDTVFIKGRLRTRNWESKNGVKHSDTIIKADNFQLLHRKNDAEKLPKTE